MIRRLIAGRLVLAAAAVAAVPVVVLAATPAGAALKPPPPTATIIDSTSGVLTTAAPVHAGTTLTFFGYVTGSVTVISATPDGPLLRITVSPAVPAAGRGNVLDAHIS